MPSRINIGCGYDKKPGYLNIDSDAACSPDYLVVDNDLSPLPQRYFEEVWAKDVLEHIPHAAMMGALVDWNWLLRPGGELFVQTSDIFGIIDLMRKNETFEFQYNWRVCLFGNQVHPGDFHLNGFTDRTLKVYLTAAGFEVDHFDHHDGWLIATRARKTVDFLDLLTIKSNIEFAEAASQQLLSRPAERSYATVDRRTLLRTMMASPERLYKTATSLGL